MAFVREERKRPVVVHDFDKVLKSLDKAVLRCCSCEWWRVFLTLLHSLGCRRGELVRTNHSPGLLWGNVDLQRATLKIVGESSKSRRERSLPLSPKLVSLLTAWRAAQGKVDYGDAVLPYDGQVRRLYDDLRRIEQVAGVSFTFKHLRSTCGSELIAAGTPTVVVKDVLGHSSVVTTERHYLDSGPSVRVALEKRG
jgi:integrase